MLGIFIFLLVDLHVYAYHNSSYIAGLFVESYVDIHRIFNSELDLLSTEDSKIWSC